MALKVNRPGVQPQVQSNIVHAKTAPAAAPKSGLQRPDASQAPKPPVTPAKVTTSASPQAQRPAAPAQQQLKVDPLLKSLAAMKDRWNKAKQESAKGGGGGTTLSASPKGERHICQLSAAKVIQGDKGTSVLLEWTCVEGTEIGEKGVVWLNFDTDEKFVWAQRILRKLEVDVDAIDDPALLPQLCEELVAAAPAARLTVKENGEYINVYVDKLVSLEGQEQVQQTEGQELPAEQQTEDQLTDQANAEVEGQTEAADPGTAENGEQSTDQANEEVGGEEIVPGLAIGDDVSYTVKGKQCTGVVKQILDDETCNVRNDITKQTENIDLIKVRKMPTT